MSDQSEQNIDGDNIDNEGISTPRGHHVEIGKGWAYWPEDTARVAGFDENVKREDQGEDSNTFVIVRPSHRPGHVTRYQSDH